VDINSLSCAERIVPDYENQNPNESRRVWGDVMKHIGLKNEDLALSAKTKLEEEQRKMMKDKKKNEVHQPKYFVQKGETWTYVGLPEIFGKSDLEMKKEDVSKSTEEVKPPQSESMRDKFSKLKLFGRNSSSNL